MAEDEQPPRGPAAPRTALTVFTGRAGDRNERGAAGTRRLGAAISRMLGLRPLELGEPRPPLGAGWAEELAAARPELAALRARVARAFAAGDRPLTVMPRCAAALATLPALAAARPDAVLVWFDAHGDGHTPATSASGYLGGMVLPGAAGLWESGLGAGLDLGQVVLVGGRDLDPAEEELFARFGVSVLAGGHDLPVRLRAALAGRPAYVHLDCDVLEPGLVPTEYEAPGGLSLDDLREALMAVAAGPVLGMEVAEFAAAWPDGRPGDPAPLVAALAPVLEALRPPAAPAAGPHRKPETAAAQAEREARLAAALRANLRRRKAQARTREGAAKPDPPPGSR
jgi:arginase